jgi:pimeloyl-ACP methyl ester carboxylesterase
MMTDRFVAVDGARLYFEMVGTGQTIVLLHTHLGDCRMWDAQFASFAESFQVIRCDLRGFGRSAAAAGSFSHAADVIGLLDHLGSAQAHLVGCGLGGRIALECALLHPERLGALVLSAPALRSYDYSDVLTQYAEANDRAFAEGDFAHVLDLDTRMWIDGPKRRTERVEPAFRERARALASEGYRSSQVVGEEQALNPPALDRLWQIKAAALVLVGEFDVPDFINIAGMVAFGLDNAQKVMIPDAAHLLPMEQPEAFNHQVLSFLNEARS